MNPSGDYKIMCIGNISVQPDKDTNKAIDYQKVAELDYDILVLFGNFGKFNIKYGYENILDELEPILHSRPIIVIPSQFDQINNG